MPKPTEPDKIPITSPAQLRTEFESIHAALALEETEHTWEKIDKAVKRFQAVVRGGAGKKELADEYVRGMRDKTLVNGLIRSLATERTRLSGSTLDLIASSTRLGPQFAPLLPLYLPTLLRLLCRTNKLYITRSTATIISIVKNTRLVEVLRFIVGEWQGESGKSATFREKAAEVTAYMLSSGAGGELILDKDVLDRRVEELEWIIKTAAVDKDVKVRAEAKKCWEVYRREWPERVASFTSPMTPTIRRYLNVTANGPATTTSARAPPVKKPRVPSALSSSVSHSSSHPASAAVPSRPVPSLSRSVGASRPLAASASHRAPHPTAAPPASSAGTLSRSTSGHSNEMAPPPARAARGEAIRPASNPSSRPGSRNDDLRKGHNVSAATLSSTRAPTATGAPPETNQGSYRPTVSARAGASSAPPFKPAVRTAIKSTASSTTSTAEPRRARRIAQDPVVNSAPPPGPGPVPVPPSSSSTSTSTSTLSRSTSSSSSTVRSQTSLNSAHVRSNLLPSASSTSAPFRPHKPTTARPPLASSSSRPPTTTTAATSKPVTATASRNGNVNHPSLATTASTAAGGGLSSSTTATRSRRDKDRLDQQHAGEVRAREIARGEERRAAAAEVAALESAARKDQEREKDLEERAAGERRLKEVAERAREVPLPVEEDESGEEGEELSGKESEEEEGEAEGEEEVGPEADHDEAFVAESQETVVGTVGMDSEYLIESQGEDDPQHQEEGDFVLNDADQAQPVARPVEVEHEVQDDRVADEDDCAEPTPDLVHDMAEDVDQVENGPESPVVDETRPVGDVPPSPFLTIPGGLSSQAEQEEGESLDEDDRDASATTIAPSPIRLHATPSPLPDVSVALDTLALTTDASEAFLLADMTLPRSPAVATVPFMSMPTPTNVVDDDEECFPQPVHERAYTVLPPLSPEPCQTASIMLETPPRLDDPPAQLRLPGRPVVALNFPGRAPLPMQAELPNEAGSQEDDEVVPEAEPTETEEEDSDEDFETASPSRRAAAIPRAVPPPTPLRSVARQRQPVFFPESASYTDVETSCDEDQDETDEEEEASEGRVERSFQVPLNDAAYDDSDSGEVEVEVRPDAVEEDEDQSTPKAQAKFEASSPVERPSSASAADLDGDAAGEAEDGDEEDESRFELERPELRFHDETESEPEVTMEEFSLSETEEARREEEEEEEAEREKAVAVEQPNIFKRSLRSRVVTVDLQQTTKTPGGSKSREILSELQ